MKNPYYVPIFGLLNSVSLHPKTFKKLEKPVCYTGFSMLFCVEKNLQKAWKTLTPYRFLAFLAVLRCTLKPLKSMKNRYSIKVFHTFCAAKSIVKVIMWCINIYFNFDAS